jgi:hypothetical protein
VRRFESCRGRFFKTSRNASWPAATLRVPVWLFRHLPSPDAVAVLPALAGITGTSYLHPGTLVAGFRTAALISGAMCAAGGLLAAFTFTNPAHLPGPPGRPHQKSVSTAASTRHRSQSLLAKQPARNDRSPAQEAI